MMIVPAAMTMNQETYGFVTSGCLAMRSWSADMRKKSNAPW